MVHGLAQAFAIGTAPFYLPYSGVSRYGYHFGSRQSHKVSYIICLDLHAANLSTRRDSSMAHSVVPILGLLLRCLVQPSGLN